MTNELPFRIIFILLFASMITVRVYYHRKAETVRERFHSEKEGKLVGALKLLILPGLVGSSAYMIHPPWVSWSSLSIPVWLRWIGAGFGVLNVILHIWAHQALDKNFSPTFRIRADHELVTHGPYRWVRHPIYTIGSLG